MSDLGPLQLETPNESVFLGRDYGKTKNFSDKVAHEIDEEERKIIDKCYEDCKNILKKNKDLVMLISDALMKYETITKEQIEAIVKNKNIECLENLEEKKEESED